MTLSEEQLRAAHASAVADRDKLDTQIRHLEALIENMTGKPMYPYRGKNPTKAAREFLEESGKPQAIEAIVKALLEGGCNTSRKWPEVEIRKSIKKNLELGNLKKDGELIALPEW